MADDRADAIAKLWVLEYFCKRIEVASVLRDDFGNLHKVWIIMAELCLHLLDNKTDDVDKDDDKTMASFDNLVAYLCDQLQIDIALKSNLLKHYYAQQVLWLHKAGKSKEAKNMLIELAAKDKLIFQDELKGILQGKLGLEASANLAYSKFFKLAQSFVKSVQAQMGQSFLEQAASRCISIKTKKSLSESDLAILYCLQLEEAHQNTASNAEASKFNGESSQEKNSEDEDCNSRNDSTDAIAGPSLSFSSVECNSPASSMASVPKNVHPSTSKLPNSPNKSFNPSTSKRSNSAHKNSTPSTNKRQYSSPKLTEADEAVIEQGDKPMRIREPHRRQIFNHSNRPRANQDDDDQPVDDFPPDDSVSSAPQKKRKYFSDDEVKWLKAGVKKYGVGRWTKILDNYPFKDRTSVNLKDKWRNLKQ
eukprot:gene18994-20905_t